MVRIARLPIAALALLALGPLAARSSPSHKPAGWQPLAGAATGWTSGAGANAQVYLYATRSFGGTLQDLASQEAVNVLLRYRGAKFHGSDPFGPCPGEAGVATFSLQGSRILERGFAVQNGKAIETSYLRPVSAQPDLAVLHAMKAALCVAPL